MSTPHIQTVSLAENGVVVTYDDASCAFYHESVLQAHFHSERTSGKASRPTRQPAGKSKPRAASGRRRTAASA